MDPVRPISRLLDDNSPRNNIQIDSRGDETVTRHQIYATNQKYFSDPKLACSVSANVLSPAKHFPSDEPSGRP